MLVREAFVRRFANGKALGAYAGLTATPYSSGGLEREQGIGKAGNRRLRSVMVELAWLWHRYQPGAAQVVWFRERVGKAGSPHKSLATREPSTQDVHAGRSSACSRPFSNYARGVVTKAGERRTAKDARWSSNQNRYGDREHALDLEGKSGLTTGPAKEKTANVLRGISLNIGVTPLPAIYQHS